uniref:Uncharacterized protein n=1 Tax=Ciona savignyi TaxID=51511 RepID=H2YAE6_CIOSA
MGSHSKRMKKRRELDALISGNRSKRGYEQLQPHLSQPDVVFSSSSRDGECIQPQLQGYGTRKRMGRSVSVRKRGCCIKQMYHLCLPACMVAMIMMCVAISIGIVWLQLHLKSEVETLKSRLARLERLERDEPASMADLHTSMSAVQHEVANIKQRIRPMQGQLASLQQQFEQQSAKKLVQKAQDEINQNMREISTEITNMENSITELQSETRQLTSESSRTTDDVTQLNHLLTQYKQ